MKYNSRTKPGSDYTLPLADMLPDLIGPRKHAKSTRQIAEKAGRARQTVERVMKRMHSKSEVHIAGWARAGGGPHFELWKLGPGADADKPQPLSATEKCKRYRYTEKGGEASKRARKKWKKSKAGKDYARKYDQNRTAKQKFSAGGVAAIDPLLAAIMGSSARSNKEM